MEKITTTAAGKNSNSSNNNNAAETIALHFSVNTLWGDTKLDEKRTPRGELRGVGKQKGEKEKKRYFTPEHSQSFRSSPAVLWVGGCSHGRGRFLFFIFTFFFPAQLAKRGFAVSDLLDKPWSRVSSLLPCS